MGQLDHAAAIAGIHEFPLRYAPDDTPLRVEAKCAQAALEDAGLTIKDVDGYFGFNRLGGEMPGFTLCDYLNLHPKIVDDTNVGGASFLYYLLTAANFIRNGMMDVGLITYCHLASSRNIAIGTGPRVRAGTRAPWWTEAFSQPYGLIGVASYSQVAQRHMYEYGTTNEQLAKIAVDTRYNASFNPDAKYRTPITVEDVVNSRMIASPLHMLDCCMISDGGGAVVVTSPERARSLKQPPVWVLGGAMAVEHRSAGYRDYAQQAAMQSGPRAFASTGVRHEDIDLAMIYDSYTVTVLTSLEGLGFCERGEGGPFVESHKLTWDGDFPVNTDGGGLSSNHPGARGIFLLIEAARQLRGNVPDRQVEDCKLAVCHGTGGGLGTWHSGVTVLLTNQ